MGNQLTTPTISGQGFVYDPVIKGIDLSFLSEITGAITQDASSNLVLNQSAMASFLQLRNGRVKYQLTIPAGVVAGTAGFGVMNPATLTGFTFSFIGGDFKLLGLKDGAVLLDIPLTFTGAGTEQIFEIAWNGSAVTFYIGGVPVYSGNHEMTDPLAMYFENDEDADMLVGYMKVSESNGIIA